MRPRDIIRKTAGFFGRFLRYRYRYELQKVYDKWLTHGVLADLSGSYWHEMSVTDRGAEGHELISHGVYPNPLHAWLTRKSESLAYCNSCSNKDWLLWSKQSPGSIRSLLPPRIWRTQLQLGLAKFARHNILPFFPKSIGKLKKQWKAQKVLRENVGLFQHFSPLLERFLLGGAELKAAGRKMNSAKTYGVVVAIIYLFIYFILFYIGISTVTVYKYKETRINSNITSNSTNTDERLYVTNVQGSMGAPTRSDNFFPKDDICRARTCGTKSPSRRESLALSW